MANNDTFMIEGAQLIFRNFSGVESQFNREGDRNFGAILDQSVAEQMLVDGWNVESCESGEDDAPPVFWIPISVGFKVRPPKVVLITSVNRTMLSEDTIGMLDWADILVADLIGRAYRWEVNGKTGIKAYLQSLYVTINEDELERKYAIPEED